jgi:hypothetical protein
VTSSDFEIEQYRALRAEILRAMEDGNQVMSFGIAAIGFVFSAGIGVRESVLGFIVLAGLVPGLGMLVLSMWFGAHERVARASFYLTGVEARLKRAANMSSPSWECWLRGSPSTKAGSANHFWNTELSGTAILFFLVLGPLYSSFFVGGASVDLEQRALVVGSVSLAIFAFWLKFKGRLTRWRSWLTASFEDPRSDPEPDLPPLTPAQPSDAS